MPDIYVYVLECACLRRVKYKIVCAQVNIIGCWIVRRVYKGYYDNSQVAML